MKENDSQGFIRALRVEAERLENALDLAQQQTSRFPVSPKREKHMKRMLEHLERVQATIRAETK